MRTNGDGHRVLHERKESQGLDSRRILRSDSSSSTPLHRPSALRASERERGLTTSSAARPISAASLARSSRLTCCVLACCLLLVACWRAGRSSCTTALLSHLHVLLPHTHSQTHTHVPPTNDQRLVILPSPSTPGPRRSFALAVCSSTVVDRRCPSHVAALAAAGPLHSAADPLAFDEPTAPPETRRHPLQTPVVPLLFACCRLLLCPTTSNCSRDNSACRQLLLPYLIRPVGRHVAAVFGFLGPPYIGWGLPRRHHRMLMPRMPSSFLSLCGLFLRPHSVMAPWTHLLCNELWRL